MKKLIFRLKVLINKQICIILNKLSKDETKKRVVAGEPIGSGRLVYKKNGLFYECL